MDLQYLDSRTVSDLLLSTPGTDTDFTMLVDTIPAEGTERENTMTRIRTEMLAGKGPDVFICETHFEDGALFPFPKQVMENRMFLPLDEYLEDAQYMEWDKLLPQVMEAGRNKDGQQLLPMGYQVRMYVMDKALDEPRLQRPSDWEDMAGSGDPIARTIAGSMPFYDMLGEFADYEKDELALTEDELFEWTRKNIDAFNAATEQPIQLAYATDGALMVMGSGGPEALELDEDEYWMLPGYNISGGVTADVTAFAGINRNTEHPAEAFRVVDFLLSKQNQAGSAIYSQALPVHMELYSEGAAWHNRTMNEWDYQQFQRVRDEINTAKFYTPLDMLAYEGWDRTADEDGLRELVHKAYVKMNMYLAES